MLHMLMTFKIQEYITLHYWFKNFREFSGFGGFFLVVEFYRDGLLPTGLARLETLKDCPDCLSIESKKI